MKRINRVTAGFLAAAMLMSGALALGASAQVSDEYNETRKSVLYTDDAEKFYSAYDALLQKYPDSPELYYERAKYRWDSDETVTHNDETRRQVIADLDRAIALSLQTEQPYQQYTGEDYGQKAAGFKAELYRDMAGEQEKVIEAEQQYLDLLDRWSRLQLNKDCDETERGWYERYLNHDIPNMRAELDKIRSWYAGGSKNYTAWAAAGADPYYEEGEWYKFNVTGSAGSKTVKISAVLKKGTPHEHVYTFSQPVQSIQRSLHGITIFVPKGTTVQVQDGTKTKDSYTSTWNTKNYTYNVTLDEYDFSSSGQGDDFDASPYIVEIVRV